ncbi:hypothetical protein BIV57_09040 [Mangrovactinospora gilvigrisea]|uniref:PPM-type phosphatase domain-containing protein n=1 Tax=Mangrovactinospora gilvigrisea TaxID=1428644 RepID=A0A1J7C865_9ACTN|nr:PP2C family protein-serine/threonine phosphatase [Mangrovactinospora gilvigrisea]OIV37716.1 hypothetical protein BIV57_09040 [Mangrovactinospora gilvigrisea]
MAVARTRRLVRKGHRRLRRVLVDYFRGSASDTGALLSLIAAVPVLTCLTVLFPGWCPPTALVLPLIAGALLLRPVSLGAVYLAAVAGMCAEAVLLDRMGSGRAHLVFPGSVLVVAAVAAAGLVLAQFRNRVGVPWRRGSSMLFDLRERLRVQSRIPELPSGWESDIALRPAGGQSFSGDFVVASRTGGGRLLEAVLTDVSGKGMDAGSRALLMSGAFGGLVGSLPPHDFLPAANGYILRQDWDEGFATAVHLVLDLHNGDFELLSAGHLPGLHRSGGSGQWTQVEAEGPLLGVYGEAKFVGSRGRLEPGDSLLLYTDGMVEAPGRDLSEGIDRLTGAADVLLSAGPALNGAAWRLMDAVAKDVNDDRAVLLLRRSAA